jgi:hypothetical protein
MSIFNVTLQYILISVTPFTTPSSLVAKQGGECSSCFRDMRRFLHLFPVQEERNSNTGTMLSATLQRETFQGIIK